MSEHTLKATGRKVEGKGASRRLRHAASIPAIVYGGKAEPMVSNPTVKQKMNAETITNEGGGDAGQDVFSRRRSIYLFVDRQNLAGALRYRLQHRPLLQTLSQQPTDPGQREPALVLDPLRCM